ncbi:MAG TPA: folate-binding protein [Thioalkalivibrio sp.]|nr:folate-binding protein [Thioalkalivibrio sp.]
MKPEWKDFLADAGAEFDDGRVTTYGNPDRERRVTTSGNVFCDLSHFGMIAAYGDDAETFLQNQLTNDVTKVDASHSQLNAYCTPKGRMMALFRLFRRGDTWYLRMPRATLEPTLERLHKFVLMAKVTLEDASGALVRLGVSGPDAVEELEKAAGSRVPTEHDAVATIGGYTVIRVPGVHPRFEVYGELESMKNLWERLNVHCAPIGASGWALLDILAGQPSVHPQTVEAFVPQMANMELINGVSFKKGCYPGQEIVARMQYLGKLKRRMYRLHSAQSEAPAPGSDVYGKGRDEPVGKVVDAQAHPDGGIELLAVLQIEAAEGGALHLDSPDGTRAQIEPLPYPLDMAS